MYSLKLIWIVFYSVFNIATTEHHVSEVGVYDFFLSRYPCGAFVVIGHGAKLNVQRAFHGCSKRFYGIDKGFRKIYKL